MIEIRVESFFQANLKKKKIREKVKSNYFIIKLILPNNKIFKKKVEIIV